MRDGLSENAFRVSVWTDGDFVFERVARDHETGRVDELNVPEVDFVRENIASDAEDVLD